MAATPTVVLLSGGLDSTVALARTLRDGPARALSVDYGQRHGARELQAAAAVAAYYGVPHDVLDLTSWGKLLPGSALTDRSVDVPRAEYDAETMAATVVPNRNAVLLMAAVGVADAHGAAQVVIASHGGDHHVYPDCRPEFTAAANEAARAATEGRVGITAPFAQIDKGGIALLGHELAAPMHLTWSCYEGRDVHCGTCGTCAERRQAFADAELTDPTTYEEPRA